MSESQERREKKLDISANIEGLLLFRWFTVLTQRQHTTVVCRGGGLNKYQSCCIRPRPHSEWGAAPQAGGYTRRRATRTTVWWVISS